MLLDYLRHLLPSFPHAMANRSACTFLAGRSLLAWHCWSESWFGSYRAAAHCDPAWVLGAEVTGHAPVFIST